MVYHKMLPHLDNVAELVNYIETFPMTAGAILKVAQRKKMGKSMLDFLGLFPDNEIFKDEEDFLTRAEEMVMMIREERQSQSEVSRSV